MPQCLGVNEGKISVEHQGGITKALAQRKNVFQQNHNTFRWKVITKLTSRVWWVQDNLMMMFFARPVGVKEAEYGVRNHGVSSRKSNTNKL